MHGELAITAIHIRHWPCHRRVAALPRLAGSPCHAVGQLADTFLDVVVQALDMAKA